MYKDPNDDETEHLIKNGPGCWERMLYNTKCQIVLVLILCAFIGIGTPFIWQLIWSITTDCCRIESDLRYDCFPLQETLHKNESFCRWTARCCWDNDTTSDQIQCYYGMVTKDVSTKMPGYSILLNSTADRAELLVDTVPRYIDLNNTDQTVGPVVSHHLSLKVEQFSPDHFRVKISSPDDNGYNLENEFQPKLKPGNFDGNDSLAEISWKSKSNHSMFSLSVKRKDTNEIIFNTGDFSPFIYAKGLIEITTLLPNDLIYGLGQSPSKGFKHNMTYPESWQIYSKYNLNLTTNQTSWFGSHPFYMGWTNDNKAYGILLLNSYPIQLITNSRPSLTFRTIGGPLDFHFFLGPKPENVYKQLLSLIGKPSLPPYWALGFHLCRSQNDLNGDEEAQSIVDKLRNLTIPFDSDCGSAAMSTVVANVKEEEDPKTMLRTYYEQNKGKNLNFKSLVVQVPHKLLGGKLDWSGTALKSPDGNTYQGLFYNWLTMDSDPKTANLSVIYPNYEESYTVPDFLSKEYAAFGDIDGTFLDYNTPLDLRASTGRNMSVLCPTLMGRNPWNLYYYWKLNEYTPCLDSTDPFNKYIDPMSIHNLYGHRHMKAVKTVLDGLNGNRKLVMSLSTFIGDGFYGGHIGTNMNATWDMLLQTHIQTLEFNMYGMPLVGFPVCGFKGKASDEELCLRWYQLAALQPFMISHRAFGETLTDPFSVTQSDSTREALKSSILIRYRLLPYLYTLFYKASTYGDPVVRPLFYDFPDDKKTFRIDRQYLLGSALMASPVILQKAKSVEAYFPKDEGGSIWYDYYSGRRIAAKEGQKFNLSAIEYHINLHLRGGYVIPTQTPGNNTEESRGKPFQLYAAMGNGRRAEGDLYIDDGLSIDTKKQIISRFTVEANNFTIINDRPTDLDTTVLKNTTVDIIKVYGIIDPLDPEWFLVRSCQKDQACNSKDSCLEERNLTKLAGNYIHNPFSGVLSLRDLDINLVDYDKFVISWTYPDWAKIGDKVNRHR